MADEKTPLLKSGENGQPPKVAFAPSEKYVKRFYYNCVFSLSLYQY